MEGLVLRLILIKRNGSLDLVDMAWDGNMYPTVVFHKIRGFS